MKRGEFMHPERKNIRLSSHDYNRPGYYFITVCTKEKKPILCRIVGTGVLDGPIMEYTKAGIISHRELEAMTCFYEHIRLEKYVIMPNHIHLLIYVCAAENGPSGRPVPTDSAISRFIGTFKRFTNKDAGYALWQARSYDHVVRDEHDFQRIWKYIDDNPAKWAEDSLYCADDMSV